MAQSKWSLRAGVADRPTFRCVRVATFLWCYFSPCVLDCASMALRLRLGCDDTVRLCIRHVFDPVDAGG